MNFMLHDGKRVIYVYLHLKIHPAPGTRAIISSEKLSQIQVKNLPKLTILRRNPEIKGAAFFEFT